VFWSVEKWERIQSQLGKKHLTKEHGTFCNKPPEGFIMKIKASPESSRYRDLAILRGDLA